MPYEVQTSTLCDGWVNTWFYDKGDGVMHPETFATAEEAQAALDEHVQELAEEFLAGNLGDRYDRDEFRIQYVPPTRTQPTINQQGE